MNESCSSKTIKKLKEIKNKSPSYIGNVMQFMVTITVVIN